MSKYQILSRLFSSDLVNIIIDYNNNNNNDFNWTLLCIKAVQARLFMSAESILSSQEIDFQYLYSHSKRHDDLITMTMNNCFQQKSGELFLIQLIKRLNFKEINDIYPKTKNNILMYALKFDKYTLSVIQALIDQGIYLDHKNANGDTALDFAIERKDDRANSPTHVIFFNT